ncbi:hypothetical protein [Nocardioides panacisoli]|uniref:Uncharacterized protein n=1 Tax=Nocardioides panacisoli TaxID=627624 RepID=A0ABP7IR89_9ACTN
MRMTRILAAVLAAVVSLALVFTVDPAVAAQHGTTAKAGTFGTFNVKAVDRNTLRAHGQASNWHRKTVLIQRRKKSGGRWVTVARDRTDGGGRFSVALQARSDIPCTGARFILRAKKANRASAKVDGSVWSCS